jgi:hypothetical protein
MYIQDIVSSNNVCMLHNVNMAKMQRTHPVKTAHPSEDNCRELAQLRKYKKTASYN